MVCEPTPVLTVATWNDPRYGFAADAERLGVDSLWSPEAWGFDAFTPLAYVAAQTETIKPGTAPAQPGPRTPAMLPLSAMSMQVLSHGRFILGIGTSGPQVMEGWHDVPFDKPIKRTRETIEIVRTITAGEKHGRIRSMIPPVHVPIYIAALGPANLRLTGELADGWIGNSFMPETPDVSFDPMREGGALAGRGVSDLDLTVSVSVEFTDDVEEAGRRHAEGYAFTFGAMGSTTNNFYNNAFERQGYGDDVREVQRRWLAGDREAAQRRVPIAIGLGTNLIGTDAMILERIRLY